MEMLKYVFYLLFAAFLWGCATPGNTPNTRYSPSKIKEEPEKERVVLRNYLLYHQDDFNSTFHFHISSYDLLFVNDQNMNATTTVQFNITVKNMRTDEIVSKDTLVKTYEKKNFSGDLFDSITFSTPMELLSITIDAIDVNKNYRERYIFETDKKMHWETYNFKVYNGNEMHFDRRSYRDTVKIVAERMANRTLVINDFTDIDNIAPPPFSEKNPNPNFENPENSYEIKFGDNGIVYVPTENGHTLQFTGNKLEKNGFFLLRFSDDFPRIKRVSSLIPPLRFITSREEYGNLMDTTNQRLKFEKFWLLKGGSKEQARYLIKTYYNRVEYANKKFTSYKEGWKTDRGMLYLIFGEPDYVYKNPDSEKWIYGQNDNGSQLRFDFYHDGGNNYSLIRNSLFKSPWYVAVENWRNGRAYKY